MKTNKINFEMDLAEHNLTNKLIDVQKQFYTVKPTKACGSLRFRIPRQITTDLNLTSGDIFTISQIESNSEYHIEFKINNKRKKNSYTRHLAYAGINQTLYACVPTQIKKAIPNLVSIALIHPTAFNKYEWIIKFLTTESI